MEESVTISGINENGTARRGSQLSCYSAACDHIYCKISWEDYKGKRIQSANVTLHHIGSNLQYKCSIKAGNYDTVYRLIFITVDDMVEVDDPGMPHLQHCTQFCIY